MQSRNESFAVAALATALAVGACSDGAAPRDAKGIALSFVVPSNRSSASVSTQRSGPSFALVSVSQTLVVDQAQLLVQRVELNTKATAAGCENDEDDCQGGCDDAASACTQFKKGPIVIDLPVGGNLLSAIVANVPPGSYDELEVKVAPPHNGDELAAVQQTTPNWRAGASIHLKGSFDAGDGKGPTAFDVSLPVRARFELDFNPALVIDAQHGTGNVTLAVDVAAWLNGPGGGFIDPNSLPTSESARLLVIRNIRASLRAFRDDDRNGKDDHDGHD